jgi:RHS repeat-associated protein
MPMAVTYTTLDGEIISETRNGVESDYLPDPLGNTVALTNSSQAKTDTWTFWPYGEVQSHVGSSVTPYTYGGTLGYRTDVASSFIYVEARELRPGLTRWQTVDPLWPEEYPYTYALDGPQTNIDPSGSQTIVIAGVACVAIFVGGCYVYYVCFRRSTTPIAEPSLPPIRWPRWPFGPRNGPTPVAPPLPIPRPRHRHRQHTNPGSVDPVGPPAPGQRCPPCPEPPPPRPDPGHNHVGVYGGVKGCCHGLHTHVFYYTQNPQTCTCYLNEKDGDCLGRFTPGLDCDGIPLK